MITHVALLAGLLQAMCGKYLTRVYARRRKEDHTSRFTRRWGTDHDEGEQAQCVEQQLMEALQHHSLSLCGSLWFHLHSVFVLSLFFSLALSLSVLVCSFVAM